MDNIHYQDDVDILFNTHYNQQSIANENCPKTNSNANNTKKWNVFWRSSAHVRLGSNSLSYSRKSNYVVVHILIGQLRYSINTETLLNMSQNNNCLSIIIYLKYEEIMWNHKVALYIRYWKRNIMSTYSKHKRYIV